MTDYKDSQVPESTTTAWPLVIGITTFIALFGWMGERDREHQREMQQVVQQVVKAMDADCAPAMEMDMPIQQGRVQL
jgi:hypothetical protein